MRPSPLTTNFLKASTQQFCPFQKTHIPTGEQSSPRHPSTGADKQEVHDQVCREEGSTSKTRFSLDRVLILETKRNEHFNHTTTTFCGCSMTMVFGLQFFSFFTERRCLFAES